MSLKENLKVKIQKQLVRLQFSEDQTYYFLTIVVGVIAGLAAVLLHKATSSLSHFIGTDTSFNYQAWIFGGIAVFISGFLTTRYFPNTTGSGIPFVKVWLIAKNGYIDAKEAFAKFLTTVLSLSSGMSLGREGPTVAISAGLGSTLAQAFSLSKKRTKSLVAQSCAAAIAAAFNAPMAAIFFTLEEIVGDMNAKTLGPVVMSAVVASFTSYIFLGNHTVFPEVHYSMTNHFQLIIYLSIGVASAFCGSLWVKFVLVFRNKSQKLFKGHKLSIMMLTFICVGLIGMYFPQILGSGDKIISEALLGNIELLQLFLLLFLLKSIVTAISYSSGISGGLFMPTLFIGAMLGGSIACIFQLFFPNIVGPIGSYVLVGMGAYFVAVIKAPFTSILIIFELTHDYKLIVPLMLANMTSYLISSRLKINEGSIYEALSEQDGVHLPSREDDEILDQLHVEDAMKTSIITLDADLHLDVALKIANESKFSGYPIVKNTKLRGVITTNELRILIAKDGANRSLSSYCDKELVTVYPDQSLLVAFHKLKKHQIGRIFVVSRLHHHQLLGILTPEDIVSQFGFHILKTETDSGAY